MQHLTSTSPHLISISNHLSEMSGALEEMNPRKHLSEEDREKIRSSLLELAEAIREKTGCSVTEASRYHRDLCP